MRKTIPSALIALIHLTLAKPHVILPRVAASCPGPETPKSFAVREIAYLRYEASAGSSPQPNTTQLVFALTNSNTGIATGCACQDIMSGGHWADDDDDCSCVERAIAVGGKTYPVKTSARVSWGQWRLAVNQTWVCDESVTTSQSSNLTLVPTCTDNKTGSQYIKECTAPDVIVSATSDNNMGV